MKFNFIVSILFSFLLSSCFIKKNESVVNKTPAECDDGTLVRAIVSHLENPDLSQIHFKNKIQISNQENPPPDVRLSFCFDDVGQKAWLYEGGIGTMDSQRADYDTRLSHKGIYKLLTEGDTSGVEVLMPSNNKPQRSVFIKGWKDLITLSLYDAKKDPYQAVAFKDEKIPLVAAVKLEYKFLPKVGNGFDFLSQKIKLPNDQGTITLRYKYRDLGTAASYKFTKDIELDAPKLTSEVKIPPGNVKIYNTRHGGLDSFDIQGSQFDFSIQPAGKSGPRSAKGYQIVVTDKSGKVVGMQVIDDCNEITACGVVKSSKTDNL